MVTVRVTLVVARRTALVVTAIATTVGITAYAVLPHLVETHLRDSLVARGFPQARLEVSSVGMGHLDLRNVHLADGFDIGALHVNRGLSLLWATPDTITVNRANVTPAALATTAQTLGTKTGGPLPFRRAEITDSTVTTAGARTRVDASATRTGSTLDIAITLRDPSPRGWTASARGQITIDKSVTLDAGHIDISIPSQRAGRVAITNAELSADIAGNLSQQQLVGRGTVTGQRIDLGAYSLTDASVPFTVDRGGLHVGGSRATTSGGELEIDPFAIDGHPFDLTLHAHGLQLGTLLAPTARATGTGRIDGELAMHVDGTGWSITSADLHAREKGAIQIADAAWRDKVSHAETPFAVHAQVANALTDFEFAELSARLAPAGDDQELRFVARGRGRRNHQELDLAIAVHGVRALTHRLPGAVP
jgi:hypothetical protein